jgi:hypothetical protein
VTSCQMPLPRKGSERLGRKFVEPRTTPSRTGTRLLSWFHQLGPPHVRQTIRAHRPDKLGTSDAFDFHCAGPAGHTRRDSARTSDLFGHDGFCGHIFPVVVAGAYPDSLWGGIRHRKRILALGGFTSGTGRKAPHKKFAESVGQDRASTSALRLGKGQTERLKWRIRRASRRKRCR